MNRKRVTATAMRFVLVGAILHSLGAAAAESAAEEKARTLCAGCHGPAGISVNPQWPNIAGQQAAYLANSISDYKAGRRNEPSMSAIATTLADGEIEALAAYYAALPKNCDR
jgi:cytochrome c553